MDELSDRLELAKSAALLAGATMKAGQPTIGVIYDPFKNELFHAQIGAGAFCNDEPIKASGESIMELAAVNCSVGKSVPNALVEGISFLNIAVDKVSILHRLGSNV